MAAGSVMNEPANGTNDKITKYMDSSRRMGNMPASVRTMMFTTAMMGRLAATTIMAKTKAGSVKLLDSTYATAEPTPETTAMKTTRTAAHTPKTASTSDS